MYFLIITFFHILQVLFSINAYMVVFLFNTVIYVFLSLCLCILIVCLCIFIVPAGTLRLPLTEVFLCFFLSCKANTRVKPAKTGHGLHSFKIFVLFYVLFVSCHSVNCVSVNVYYTTATGCLPNCSYQIYHIISYQSIKMEFLQG
jgi:hypothetical protein